MAGPLTRKIDDDALYACRLCSFLDRPRIDAEGAAASLRAVEETLAILRSIAGNRKLPAKAVEKFLTPLYKERRNAIRTLVNAGMLEPLRPLLEEWGRFGDWKPLKDYASAVRRRANPTARLPHPLTTHQEPLSYRIDEHDDELASRDACRRHLPALAVDCFVAGDVELAAAMIIMATEGRRVASTPVRTPLVPGEQATVSEDTATRAHLHRLNAAGVLSILPAAPP